MNKFTKAIACITLLGSGASAFTTPQSARFATRSIVDLQSSPLFPHGVEQSTFALSRQSETKLFAQQVGEPSNDSLLPSGIFLASAASLALLAVEIHDSTVLPDTLGTWALFWTTLAVGWDNLIIGLGKPLFADVETNESKFNILKNLSFPRFTAHAVLLPLLYTTDAEIGKALGVDWLQGDNALTLITVAALALGIISRVRFVGSEGIELADTSDSPAEAWERSLIWFTYVKAEFLYIVPAILLALFNLYIGVTCLGSDNQTAAIEMLVAGAAVLYGNSKPSEVMRFTGNLAEVAMLWLIFEAATNVF